MSEVEPIRTQRLELVSMSVPFMKALLVGDVDEASREMGATTPAWMPDDMFHTVIYRLGQLTADPAVRQWLTRAMVLTDESGARRVIGAIGFHGPPDQDGRLEMGYRVDPEYRQQGYARESATAMYDWAHREHGVTTFVAAVAPDNVASLNLIKEFSYVQIGEQMDEIDGLEYVFETHWPLGATTD